MEKYCGGNARRCGCYQDFTKLRIPEAQFCDYEMVYALGGKVMPTDLNRHTDPPGIKTRAYCALVPIRPGPGSLRKLTLKADFKFQEFQL